MKISSKITVAGAAALAMAIGSAALAGTATHQSAASGSSMQATPAATSQPVAPKPAMSVPSKKSKWTRLTLTHAQVMTVQKALVGKGYTIRADGIWGKKTRTALMDFQKKNGLPITGHPDDKTLTALGVAL